MKQLFLMLIIILLSSIKCLSQEVIESGSIYFQRSPSQKKGNETILYFSLDKNARSVESSGELPEKLLISLKNKQNIDVYWKWINPLGNKIIWKDSILVDETYENVEKYLSSLKILLIPQSILEDLSGDKALVDSKVKSLANNDKKTGVDIIIDPAKPQTIIVLKIPSSLNNANIKNLYFSLLSVKDLLTTSDIEKMNSYFDEVESFDKLLAKDNQQDLKKYFKDLVDLNSAAEARITSISIENNIVRLESDIKDFEDKANSFLGSISKIELSNNLLTYQVNYYLSEAVSDAKRKAKSEKEIISNLKPLIETIKESYSTPALDIRIPDREEYIKVKSFSFATGKKLQSKMTLQKYSFNEKDIEFNKSGDPLVKEFTIQKYNFIYPTFSTGLFYSTSSINYLGLTNVEDSEDFKITEEEIEKNSPSFAAFMNLNFDIKSDFLAPFIQFGIDPTKNRPFILSGIGLYVPVSKFAISGGGVWVFDQQLKTLSIGDKVASTTDLTKDISYTLNPKPQGFYIGVQYAF